MSHIGVGQPNRPQARHAKAVVGALAREEENRSVRACFKERQFHWALQYSLTATER